MDRDEQLMYGVLGYKVLLLYALLFVAVKLLIK